VSAKRAAIAAKAANALARIVSAVAAPKAVAPPVKKNVAAVRADSVLVKTASAAAARAELARVEPAKVAHAPAEPASKAVAAKKAVDAVVASLNPSNN
jgi:hypothetical protein